MKRPLSKLLRLGAAALALSLFASCSPGRIGWGLVLWSVPGTQAKAGTLVPIYLKSNITKNYVVGLEAERGRKIEVPLWQVEAFRTKSAAQKRLAAFGDLTSIYLVAVRDGLPVREKPDNGTGIKKVYRLRKGEMVKALEKVQGVDLYTGGTKLEGDWYRVLTADGTLGYCFSRDTRVFDESLGEQAPAGEQASTDPAALNALFSKAWRPAWYPTMMDEGTVDLDYFDLRFGLFGDPINKQIRVETPGGARAFSYESIGQDSGWLTFPPTDLRIKVESESSILAAWGALPEGEPEDAAGWKAGDSFIRFVVPQGDLRAAIRAEEGRRLAAGKDFFAAARSAGAPDAKGALRLSSPQGGTLELWPSGLFSWKNAQALPAGFAPDEGSEGSAAGTVVFGLRLGPELSGWQGGFSLYADTGKTRADYLYRFGPGGFVLARALSAPPGMPVSETDKRLGSASFDFAH